ncbi:caspase domain-containing protein [Actinoplanes sp. NPDC051494]|uniref:caspase domain-containing protein n=1 Tax=Actinoplanes sp. NPDC051494 TaxID=3363907 RepID=UPI0037B624BD
MGRYALLVAAGDYEDPYFEQLRSPEQDVRGLAAVLRDPAVGGFEVTVMENTADHEVRRMLDELTADRAPDDMVLVYFSCHGLQDIHGRLYFATTTTWAQRPAGTAIAASFVTECLERTAAGGRLLMLDCCYSGAFARGFAKTSPRPLDGEISRGYVCLTACNEYELAYEGESVVVDEPRPSVFTEVVIEGLRTGAADLDRDGWVESGELHRYASDAVRRATRQTPSYFAAGVQTPLLVARSANRPAALPGGPVPEHPAAAMTRTPKFFAARFPPFQFAREDRATPTHLAEAMARRRDEAVALFRSDESRAALYEWISHDVHDRNLERTILRRAPDDTASAEAAVGTFIATFAPHLPACFQGREVSVGHLTELALRAAEGDSAALASVTQLFQHNVLRTVARHNCRDATHPCGPGKACAVLLTAAERWDDLVPVTMAAVDELPRRAHPGRPAVVAQLLMMILDAAALKVPHAHAGAQRDMPTWWLRLILATRVTAGIPDHEHARTARLALAALTHDAARAERDHLRERERGRTTGPAAAGRVGAGRVAATVIAVPASPVPRRPGRLRRRAAGITVLVALISLLGFPVVRDRWREQQHLGAVRHAEALGVTLDDRDRPIPAECGVRHGNDDNRVVLALVKKTGTGCRAATVYLEGRRTGEITFPGDARWTFDSRFWVTSPDTAAVLTVAAWIPADRRWRLIATTVGSPRTGLWTKDLDRVDGTAGTLKAVRWGSVLAFPGPDGIYAVDLHLGRELWRHSCPSGHAFEGLGGAHPDGVGMYCGRYEKVYSG